MNSAIAFAGRHRTWPRMVLVLAAFTAAHAAHADSECLPLKEALARTSRGGYVAFLYANEIAKDGDALPRPWALRSPPGSWGSSSRRCATG